MKLYLTKNNIRYDIIIVVETWLKTTDVAMYDIAGYNAYHSIRELKGGGGVSMWISDKYTSNILYEFADLYNHFLMISIKPLNINMLAVYNTNNNTFLDILDELLTNNDNCYVMGDMNIDLLSDDNTYRKYSNIINSSGYNILNNVNKLYSTRKTTNTQTIIDHILTDILSKKYTLTINTHCFTDHESLTLQINTNQPISNKRIVCKKHTNLNQILLDYNAENDELISYSQFHTKVTNHIHRNTAIKTKSVSYKNKLPYVTNELRKLIKKRDSLYITHRKHPNNEIIKNQFLTLRNMITSKLRRARKQFEMNRVNEAGSDSRKLWQVLNSCLFNRECKNSTPKCLFINNGYITDPKAIANQFNNYFISTNQCYLNVNSMSYDLSRRFRAGNTFSFMLLTDEEVIKTISSLKENTSPGYDNITLKIIKLLVPDHISTFTNIINNIISSQQYPDELKIAKVIPIYKKGRKNDPTNYRPISIIPTFSKIIESFLYQQITKFLQISNFFHPDQYGFIPKSGTEIAAINLIQGLNKSIDKCLYTSAIFIDLKKAFDSINRNVLIQKLCSMNISNSVVNLFISFLKNRKQFTVIDNDSSELKSSDTGVPQGSILAALLFLIYINDIFTCNLHGTMQLYADDIVIYYSCKSVDVLKLEMQNDLNTIKSYMEKNLLTINIDKTKYILFKSRFNVHNNFDVLYDNKIISKVNDITYLGLKINKNLNWISHIDFIKNKISCLVGALKKTSKILPKCALKKIYFAHVYPNLIYLSPIWANAPEYKINELCVLQNKAIKTILRKPSRTATNTLYNETFIPIPQIVHYNQILLIHKIRNNFIRHSIPLVFNNDVHSYNTRASNQIYRGAVRTNSGKKSTMYQAIEKYNNIPSELKNIANLITFKKKLKQHLNLIARMVN